MITIEQADHIIFEHLPTYSPVEAKLEDSYGRILLEPIYADRNLPPYNKALMDGIAINFADWERGTKAFQIVNVQAAGYPALNLSSPNTCTEIMTGAVLTNGTDCVVPIEDIIVRDKEATIKAGITLKPMQNIQVEGAEYQKGDELLSVGSVILPPQIAVLASVGKSKVQVSYKPKIAIVSTGDEIVDITVAIKPYQIRKSNGYFLKTAFDNTDLFESCMFHMPDNKKVLLKKIKDLLKSFDVLVFTGGVSKGKFDYIPEVLQELNVKQLFHTVAQRPGKPFWFGTSQEGQPVFALPGNPVATQVAAFRYIIKHFRKKLGARDPRKQFAILVSDFHFEPSLTYFLPVKINCNDLGQLQADPVLAKSSGDFASLGNSDGFIELPAEQSHFSAGYKAHLYRWRNIR